ncbi:MAG: 30S ribosomal protein S9 [Candidatus Aenigmatarchaeota archaeon]|nr:MAG: 30S ribosomal protein S9 [Candidatus Aenigmarchaeota archaeon]
MSKKDEKAEEKKAETAKAGTAESAPEQKGKAQPRVVFSTGKRRKAVASASLKPGKGIITLNSKSIDDIDNKTVKLLLQEPLMLVGEAWKKFNIKVTSKGGGIIGQAQAARQAIAKALSESLGADARKVFMSYDRNMLVYDQRRTETHKSPRSSQGPRRAKQKSKR